MDTAASLMSKYAAARSASLQNNDGVHHEYQFASFSKSKAIYGVALLLLIGAEPMSASSQFLKKFSQGHGAANNSRDKSFTNLSLTSRIANERNLQNAPVDNSVPISSPVTTPNTSLPPLPSIVTPPVGPTNRPSTGDFVNDDTPSSSLSPASLFYLSKSPNALLPSSLAVPNVSPTVSQPTIVSPIVSQPTIVSPIVSQPTIVSPIVSQPTIVSPIVSQPSIVSPNILGPSNSSLPPSFMQPAIASPIVVGSPILNPSQQQPTLPTVPTLAPNQDISSLNASTYDGIASIVSRNNISYPDTYASTSGELQGQSSTIKDTPQQKALIHFASNDTLFANWMSLPPQDRPAEKQMLQRYAAGVFYMATGGEYWTNNSNWMEGNVHECSWYGIECIELDSLAPPVPRMLEKGRGRRKRFMQSVPASEPIPIPNSTTPGTGLLATKLQLVQNNLTGYLPGEIKAFENLQLLSLYSVDRNTEGYNNLTGPLPTEIGSMPSLTRMWLSGNRINGSIPTEIGVLTNMTDISMSNNSIVGSLPTELGQLTNLKVMSVWNNNMTGTLPSEMGMWTNLKIAFFDQNNFTGSLPEEIGAWSNLKDFRIYQNQLTGGIPFTMRSMSNLTRLYMDTNALNGEISAGAVSGWTSLEQFEAYNNSITGPLPPEFGTLTNLRTILLHHNALTGEIPSTICSTNGSLVTIQLSSNSLAGTIPSSIGNCSNLVMLYLDSNTLTGPIPSVVSQLTKLTYLQLQNNLLTGNISSDELNGTSPLRVVRLEENSLTGSINSAFCVGKTVLTADCNPSDAKVNCPCCTECF